MRNTVSLGIKALLIAACGFGCESKSAKAPLGAGAQIKPAPIVPRVPEPWISKPKSQWPQIVLTNRAEFKGHTGLEGASSFLIKTNDGRVLAATAAHLVGPAGGVEPQILIDGLTPKIKSWVMFPRTLPQSSVEITGVGVQGLKIYDDWLILSIKKSDTLPAYPLKVRSDPVRVGEKVYLIGCAYADRNCRQNVYEGVVTERPMENNFRHSISPPVDIRGFSGAPIVDKDGYLVGVMGIWFEPKMSGDKHLESGGEDASAIHHLLQTP